MFHLSSDVLKWKEPNGGWDGYKQPLWQLSQPTLRREGDAGLAGACSKKGICAESPPPFI